MIHLGDLFDVLPTLAEHSVDACVTDPPYGIGYGNRKWDTFSTKNLDAKSKSRFQQVDSRKAAENPNIRNRKRSPAMSPSQIAYDRTISGQRAFQAWVAEWGAQVLRVLRPGGYALVCGAPRSGHRLASGLEDAGFEIRDCFSWLFGQGFPKSIDVQRAIDMALCEASGRHFMRRLPAKSKQQKGDHVCVETVIGKLWAGYGSGLKPAWEPIYVARKPLGNTLVKTVMQHQTGALNVHGCRLEGGLVHHTQFGQLGRYCAPDGADATRWPPNVALDDFVSALLDAQAGDVGASRFFYTAKPSRRERDRGCEYMPERTGGEATNRQEGSAGLANPRAGAGRTGGGRNIHPTVKPVSLMQWLVRLVTQEGATVLDPFMGSGTTGAACLVENRLFIGIERELEYFEIAKRRIEGAAPLFAQEVG